MTMPRPSSSSRRTSAITSRERGEREIVAPHRLDRDAVAAHGRDRLGELVDVARGEPVAPGRDLAEVAGRPVGRIDHRLHGDGGLAPRLVEGAEISGDCGIHRRRPCCASIATHRSESSSFFRPQRCNSGRPLECGTHIAMQNTADQNRRTGVAICRCRSMMAMLTPQVGPLMHAIVTLALAALLPLAAPARADDFYQGKTLTIVVGYTAGGGYDINARLVSRHFGRHIPGTPNIVVVNMPGAGSLRSLEHHRTARAEGRHRHRPVRLHPDHQLAADARQGADRFPQVQMDRQRRSRIWRSATSGTRSRPRRSPTCSACRRSTWGAPIPAPPPTPSSASCASCSTSMCTRSPAMPAARKASSPSSAASSKAAA